MDYRISDHKFSLSDHEHVILKGTEMLFTSTGKLLAIMEVQFMVFFAALAEATAKMEVITSDELVIMWCVIGGLGGSVCSLHFFQPKDRVAGMVQVVINLVLAACFSPWLVDMAAIWTGYPLGLKLALPISCAVGIIDSQAVARALPYLAKWFDKKADKTIDGM